MTKTRNQSKPNNNNNNITTPPKPIPKQKPKSKFSSVNIIRDNQPSNFRQDNNDNNPPFPQRKSESSHSDEEDDAVWEDVPTTSSTQIDYNNANGKFKGVTVEFEASPLEENDGLKKKKKRVRRASAYDKEVAELVHKVHLLCLIGRGRLIDKACDDPLIQAALLSLVPSHLQKISDVTNLTASALNPLVSWFHRTFQVRNPKHVERPFASALASALEAYGGSPEEVAALSVALFRALNLTTRFVTILDVASLKPETDEEEPPYSGVSRKRKDIFDSSTLMVCKTKTEEEDSLKISTGDKENISKFSVRAASVIKVGESVKNVEGKEPVDAFKSNMANQSLGKEQNASEDEKCPRRKGDLEFEMQMEMALNATSVTSSKRKLDADVSSSLNSLPNLSSPLKKIKGISEESPSSSSFSTAIGSKKVGSPLYWAEVYCSGENMNGKWVHVDVVNAIVDGELKVENAAAACKTSLRYVVAFAGNGAKDVTRRYCTKWYKVSPNRVSSGWWDTVLFPLKELESRATGGMNLSLQGHVNSMHLAKAGEHGRSEACTSGSSFSEATTCDSSIASRANLEDMELATRALTEPLPTSQQAYKNHPLYALEKWLTKYQTLHPKGPMLGFCSGHAVYPRTCVQTLHTKERWLREGLKVRDVELPAKVVKSSYKNRGGQTNDAEDCDESGSQGFIDLFGKWQTEPLCLPPAVGGIVPKNERGQVDAWSEKCLPPGTLHLRLPRLVPVAKRLGIDFAPAMVGFEFRNGRSVPVYEGIVVCTEFKETILEAYAEEEQRRVQEEKKRDERQALSRWYQLLSSMITRQRLNNTYMNDLESETIVNEPLKVSSTPSPGCIKKENESTRPCKNKRFVSKDQNSERIYEDHHEHVFLTDDESYDDETMTQTKRCRCGVSVEVEEL